MSQQVLTRALASKKGYSTTLSLTVCFLSLSEMRGVMTRLLLFVFPQLAGAIEMQGLKNYPRGINTPTKTFLA